MACSSSGPQPWSCCLSFTDGHDQPRSRTAHHGSTCLQKNGVFYLPSPTCTPLLLSSPAAAPMEMLHSCHKTQSRGKEPAPQDESGTLVQHHQLLHRGSPGPLSVLWQVKSSSVPYKPLPRSPEHKGDKNDRAVLGERFREATHC